MSDKLLCSARFLSLWERETEGGGKYFIAARGSSPLPAHEDKKPDAVVIIAVLRNEGERPKLVMISEYRPAIGCREIGFPAGLVDDEDYEEDGSVQGASRRAAIRELKEETGLDFSPLYPSPATLYSSAGMTNESVIIWFGYASGEPNTEGNEAGEDIEILLPIISEAADLLREENVAFGKVAWPFLWAFSLMGDFTIEKPGTPLSGDGWTEVSRTKNLWNTNQPPNETLVEVELDKEIIQVMAFYGRDGTLPHWRTEDGSRCWPVSAFSRWRAVHK